MIRYRNLGYVELNVTDVARPAPAPPPGRSRVLRQLGQPPDLRMASTGMLERAAL